MSHSDTDFELLELFHETLGAIETRVPLTANQLESLGNRAPVALVEFWRKHGWCTYLQGLIRTVNPDDYSDVLSSWQLHSDALVFAQSAFGDLVCIQDDRIRIVFVHTATGLTSKLRYAEFLASQFFPDDVNGFFFGQLYQQAIERSGRLTSNEIFTFEPALALGGTADVSHITRAQLKPALALLSQLVDRIEDYY
jgi:hypothetical protein